MDQTRQKMKPSKTELEDNSKYYFAMTAFGVEGNESNYSNELCVQVAGLSVTECRSADDGDSGGADSGSGWRQRRVIHYKCGGWLQP